MATRVQINYVNSPEATARAIPRMVRESLRAVATDWHAKTLPGHFKRDAKQKYAYETRDPSYTRGKRRRFGHADPLVYHGDLKRQVLRMARVTATSKRARVVLSGPRYLYAYRKDYSQPDKAAELTATTKTEADQMARDVDSELQNQLALMRTTETRTFR